MKNWIIMYILHDYIYCSYGGIAGSWHGGNGGSLHVCEMNKGEQIVVVRVRFISKHAKSIYFSPNLIICLCNQRFLNTTGYFIMSYISVN